MKDKKIDILTKRVDIMQEIVKKMQTLIMYALPIILEDDEEIINYAS